MTNIHLIRHAESTGNASPKLYLQQRDCDIEITEKGREQALNLGKQIVKDQYINRHYCFEFYVSPFTRTRQTFEIIQSECAANHINNLNPKFDVRLREREWGNLRNIIIDKSHTNNDFTFFNRPLNGESFADCYNRVAQFGFELFTRLKREEKENDYNLCGLNQDIYIITHGEWIKLFLMWNNNQDFREFETTCKNFKIGNCEVITTKMNREI